MAIGMGRMIGIHYLENFIIPIWRLSVTVLAPIIQEPYAPYFVVWALTGLWHGASWNLWGIYFFIFISLEKLFLGKLLGKNRVLAHLYLP